MTPEVLSAEGRPGACGETPAVKFIELLVQIDVQGCGIAFKPHQTLIQTSFRRYTVIVLHTWNILGYLEGQVAWIRHFVSFLTRSWRKPCY